MRGPARLAGRLEGLLARRWIAVVLRVVALLLILRALLALAQPALIDYAASKLELDSEYEDLDLSLLTGEVELRGLRLEDAAPGADDRSWLEVDFAAVDVAVWESLWERPTIERIGIEGLRANVEVSEDGGVPWLERFARLAGPAREEPSTRDPLDWRSPILVRSASAQRIAIHVDDASVSPAFAATLSIDARAANLGGDGELEVWATSPGLLDTLRLEGSASSDLREAALDLAWRFEGLALPPLTAELGRAGLRPAGKALSGGGRVRVGLAPASGGPDACEGGASLDALAIRLDGEPVFSVESISVALRSLSRDRVEIASVRVLAPAASTTRAPDGAFGLAGLEWIGVATPSSAESKPSATAAPLPSAAPASTWSFVLDELSVEEGRLRLDDRSAPGAEPIAVDLARFAVRDLAWPPDDQGVSGIELRLASPGVVDSAEISGELRSTSRSLGLSAEVRAGGVTLQRLAPQLASLGLAPDFESGELGFRVRSDVDLAGPNPRVSAAVESLRFDDGRPLARLSRAGIEGLHSTADGALAAQSVDVEGAELAVRRDANGAAHLLGLRTVAREPQTELARGDLMAPNPLELPRLRLGEFRVAEARLALLDEAVAPTVERTVTATFDISQLDTTGESIGPTRIEVRLSSRGLAEELSVIGPLHARRVPPALVWTGMAQGSGLALEPLAPYLAELGLEPTLRSGSLAAELSFSLERAGSAWRAGASIVGARIADGEKELASLGALRLKGLTLGARSELDSFELFQPRVALSRDAEGRFHALGVRSAAANEGEAVESGERERAPLPEPRFAVPSFELGEWKVEDARVTWTDAAAAPPVETELVLDGRVAGLATGGGPATFEAEASISGAADELRASGALDVRADAVALSAELVADGLRAGPIASYLPPGIVCELERGRLRAPIEARVASHPEGGISASFGASGVSFADGELTLATLERASLAATRIDARARVYDIGEIVASGAELAVEHERDGSWRALGLKVSPVPAPKSSVPAVRRPPPSFVGEVPTLRLGVLELGLSRLELRDEGLGAGAQPLVLSASLSTPEPLTLLASNAEDLPPLRLNARAALDPLCESVEADLVLVPFAAEPLAQLDLRVRGLHGQDFARVAPALASTIDASGLESGELDLRASARLELSRRGPLGIDYAQGIRGELLVDRAELRARPEGEVVAGVGSIRAELSRYDAASGDARFKSIEIVEPRLRASRDAAGIHALGLTWRLPETTDEAPSARTPPIRAEPASTARETLERAPELAIDRFAITGLDVVLVDASAPEPVRVPLTDLELEVRKLSTHALAAGEPVQFQVLLESGAVSLPQRIVADSLLEGVAGAAAAAIAGRGDIASAREERPLFGAVTLSGRVAPFPAPHGWVALDVSELELAELRPLAALHGVEIGDGLLDLSARARLAGEKGLSLDSTASFAYLALSEPSDGPISRYLSLPAPLDTALFLLEDAEGRHRIPISVRVGSDGLGGGQVAAAAAQAAAAVVARAIASSPLRLAGTLTDALGLTGGPAPEPGADARSFEFEAGGVAMTEDPVALERLRRRLEGDLRLVLTLRHEFGRADLERAARLANPAAEDCRLVSGRLRQRKAELSRMREELAAQTRAEYALGRAGDAERTRERVRALDRELGSIEGSLDRLHELLRPGAERRQAQRARGAALAIAGERLERVRQALIARGVAPERVEVRSIRAVAGARDAGGRVVVIPRKR